MRDKYNPEMSKNINKYINTNREKQIGRRIHQDLPKQRETSEL